ncbi:MAG: hypothetical protein KAX20_05145 [Candidatus Omnitrophica bacterium]|nr:hypothetical protein [Candidatus Omnitrophota bacterium]
MKNKAISPRNYNNLLGRVADILLEARSEVVREVNKVQVFPIRQMLSDESKKFQRVSGKSETPSRKSAIQQAASAELDREKGRAFIVDRMDVLEYNEFEFKKVNLSSKL